MTDNLAHGHVAGRGHLGRHGDARGFGVDGLAADHQGVVREHAEGLGHDQRPFGRGQVDVGQEVVALAPLHVVDVGHLDLDEHHVAGWATPVDGVDDDQGVVARLQLLDQGDAADPRLHHLDAGGQVHGHQARRHLDAEGIVGPQLVPHAGHQHPHARAGRFGGVLTGLAQCGPGRGRVGQRTAPVTVSATRRA
jgi:hypothetical protein